MSWAKLKRGDPAEYARRIANRSRAGIKGAAVIRRDKIGVFDPKVRQMGIEALRKRGISFFDPKVQREMSRRAVRLAKLRKTSFFDPTHRIQKMGAKKGGVASRRACRMGYPYRFMGVSFDSEGEKQTARELNNLFGLIPVEGITCHYPVNGGEIDFKIPWAAGSEDGKKTHLFIEYHPWDRNGLTRDQYYARRRRLLDDNGFQDCRLVVAKSLEEIKQLPAVLQNMCIGGVSN